MSDSHYPEHWFEYPEVEYPRSNSWAEYLRFMAQTMEPGDPYLGFVVSLWSYALKNDGLTEKQVKAIQPFCDKYMKENINGWLLYDEREKKRRQQTAQTSGNVIPFEKGED